MKPIYYTHFKINVKHFFVNFWLFSLYFFLNIIYYIQCRDRKNQKRKGLENEKEIIKYNNLITERIKNETKIKNS